MAHSISSINTYTEATRPWNVLAYGSDMTPGSMKFTIQASNDDINILYSSVSSYHPLLNLYFPAVTILMCSQTPEPATLSPRVTVTILFLCGMCSFSSPHKILVSFQDQPKCVLYRATGCFLDSLVIPPVSPTALITMYIYCDNF